MQSYHQSEIKEARLLAWL